MRDHPRHPAHAPAPAGGAADESTVCTDVQFDADCREAAALRLASACASHPGGQAGVARQIGMRTASAIKRFQRYCTGEKTAPSSVVEKLRLRSPTVFAAWAEGLRRDALPRPAARLPVELADARREAAHARTGADKADEIARTGHLDREVIARDLEIEERAIDEERVALKAVPG